MTIAHAITSPSGARTKSQRETPYKHSVCSRQLEMCSVSHLLYLWCISSRALQYHVDQSKPGNRFAASAMAIISTPLRGLLFQSNSNKCIHIYLYINLI